MKIFLLDDDNTLITDFVELAGKVSEISGTKEKLEIVACRDLETAREKLFGKKGTHGVFEEINIFLIDYYLDKGESGINIIEQIRQRNKKVPIVLLTGYDNSKNAFEAGELGATIFSLKDDLISPDSLKTLIEQVLAKSKS